ncbi:hypothetical protein [Herminiimonas arsenitoxidans]|uniref:hypothetical protein n=1 Tax=Herminiimonas arsenitoxidans TaxID=1809410 RepID=UPI0009705017|nr:hypothetical protein [Herminiimonas arsenitoxidans]
MTLDTSNFPLVWMCRLAASTNQDAENAFKQLDELLAKQQPFVLLSQDEVDENHEHSPQERKQITLWMKKNKSEIRTWIKGMVQIEPSTVKRLGMRAFAKTFAKFWGYPLFVVASKADALLAASLLLHEKQLTQDIEAQ